MRTIGRTHSDYRESHRTGRRRCGLLAAACIAILLSGVRASAQGVPGLLVDTGPGNGANKSGDVQVSLRASADETFQHLAGQFFLDGPATLDSIKAWLGYIQGGDVIVKIYMDDKGLPGTSVAEHKYTVAGRGQYPCDDPQGIDGYCIAGWVTFAPFVTTLQAGTYWIAFEPQVGFSSAMPHGAPHPLLHYAFRNDRSGGEWRDADPCYDPYQQVFIRCTMGIQIFGTRLVSSVVGSGTAARAILDGTFLDNAITPIDTIDGHLGQDTQQSAHDPSRPLGGTTGIANLSRNPLSVAVVAGTVGFATCGNPCTESKGAARAIAYGEFRNDTDAVATIKANAILTGIVGQPNFNIGHATSAIYVFDKDAFVNRLNGLSGVSPWAFLLGSNTLLDFEFADPSKLSIARLMPTAVKAQVFEVTRPTDVGEFYEEVATPSTNVDPGQSVIIMLDASVYQGPGGMMNLARTFKPAPVFLTDEDGNPAPLTSVGPWTPPPPPATSLTLTPSATTNPIAAPVTITAAASAGGTPVANTLVFFEIGTGPNAPTLWPVVTDADGHATFSYSGGPSAGTDQIQASIDDLHSNVAQVTWTTPGPVDQITISPVTATISVGGSQTYATQALDIFQNFIADVSGSTTFTIAPDGSCSGTACTASVAGPHTVMATYNGKSTIAALNVTPVVAPTYTFQGFFQPIGMSTPDLTVWNTVKAGQMVPVKWLLTLSGAPVSNPASFVAVLSYPIECSSGAGSIDNAIAQTPMARTGLQYNGGGNWQYNWQTQSSFRGTCRGVVVKFSDGTTSPVAKFKLR